LVAIFGQEKNLPVTILAEESLLLNLLGQGGHRNPISLLEAENRGYFTLRRFKLNFDPQSIASCTTLFQ